MDIDISKFIWQFFKKLAYEFINEDYMDFIMTMFSIEYTQLLFFFILTTTIASCWVFPRWISYVGYVLTCALAYWYQFATDIGFVYLLLIICGLTAFHKGPLLLKGGIGIFLVVLIFSLYIHVLPGFYNFKIINQIKLSYDSKFYSAYVNIDKVMAGTLLLLFYSSLNKSFKDWIIALRVLPMPLLFVCILLLGTAFAMNYIKIDFKIPSILGIWIPTNLLLVCVIEEIFYRGFIQNELVKAFSSYKKGNWFALGISSIIFGASHYTGGFPYIVLSTFAGGVYGYVFMRSHRIESSIMVHFLVNLIHILAFSYPSLG